GTVTNCYFLKGTAYAAIRNGMGDAYDWTAERFASGQICWKLNGSTSEGELAWYQNLSGNADAYPVLDSSHGTVYYGYDACTLTYSNHALQPTPEHSYDANGFCTGCGDDYQPATLISEGNYEIANAGQLYWFANQVNSGNTTINGKLTADIVVNHNVLTAAGELNGDGSGFRVWTPIGSVPDGKQFDGLFDGQGHTISGLYINDEEKDAGLFNCISRNGKIKNVGVADSYFNAQSAGGICNTIIGTVENCFNAATCHGDDTGGTSHAGCIAYMNFGIIRNCYNKGLMKGYGPSVCYNNENGTVTNCYYLKGTASIDFAYGSGDATVKTAAQFASGEVTWLLNGSTAEGELAWHQNLSRNADAFPVLDSSHGTVYQGYNGCTMTYSNTSIPTTAGHPSFDANGFCTNCGGYQPATLVSEGNYEIANAGQLYWFAEQVISGSPAINGKLTADIVVNHNVLDSVVLDGDGSGFRAWTPIGIDEYGQQFDGIFDGQGHTISGLYVNDKSKSYVGLFGSVGTNSKIKKVGVTDSYFYADKNVAGICGLNGGTVENCFNAATCQDKSGTGGAAGIVSWNTGSGIMRNCYNKGLIEGYSGGVCYNNAGTITNCYNLQGTAYRDIFRVSDQTLSKTAEQFASGEVTWLLNDGTAESELAWYQKLGDNGDPFPVLTNTGNNTVYRLYADCESETFSYSNNPQHPAPGHHFASGSDVKCDYCDTWKIACFAGQPNGIVRPYPGTLVGDVTLYECKGINGDELHGSALNNKTIAAAHPYIFKAEAGCDTIYFKASNTSVTPPQGRIVLNGMYAYLNPDGYEQQINNNNEFIKFTQNGLRFLNSGQHTFMSGTVLINLSAARAFFNAANPGVALASIGNDLGDVNGDGSVNVIDMNLVINAILAGAGNTSLQGREDVNGDGEINIIDVNAIINIILGNG
ncbi:MAG: hypothetical protein HUK11_05255, partial [Muribaculaceae bacterium]|nr:hypothetical protein [Muribaculaceae bacterium]